MHHVVRSPNFRGEGFAGVRPCIGFSAGLMGASLGSGLALDEGASLGSGLALGFQINKFGDSSCQRFNDFYDSGWDAYLKHERPTNVTEDPAHLIPKAQCKA